MKKLDKVLADAGDFLHPLKKEQVQCRCSRSNSLSCTKHMKEDPSIKVLVLNEIWEGEGEEKQD